MIDARELRLGNLLQRLDNIVCVNAIYRSHFNCTNIKNGVDYGNNRQTNYQPIPLTEQWLLDFGFEIDGVWCYLDFEPRMQIRFYGGNSAECDIVQDGKFIAFKNGHIKHVHQLQNLYYALTGQELELNKK